MPENRDDNMPTIVLDDVDLESFKRGQNEQLPNENRAVIQKKSKLALINGILLVITSLACGYLYFQNTQQIQTMNNATNRIAVLEDKLSITDEEIGNSTVELKVNVTELTAKTNELWTQMDKLWASAWRRNQNDIASLNEKTSQISETQKVNFDAKNEKIKQLEQKLATKMKEMSIQKIELADIKETLLSFEIINASKDSQFDKLQNDFTQLRKSNNQLTEKLSNIEKLLQATTINKQVRLP